MMLVYDLNYALLNLIYIYSIKSLCISIKKIAYSFWCVHY